MYPNCTMAGIKQVSSWMSPCSRLQMSRSWPPGRSDRFLGNNFKATRQETEHGMGLQFLERAVHAKNQKAQNVCCPLGRKQRPSSTRPGKRLVFGSSWHLRVYLFLPKVTFCQNSVRLSAESIQTHYFLKNAPIHFIVTTNSYDIKATRKQLK